MKLLSEAMKVEMGTSTSYIVCWWKGQSDFFLLAL